MGLRQQITESEAYLNESAWEAVVVFRHVGVDTLGLGHLDNVAIVINSVRDAAADDLGQLDVAVDRHKADAVLAADGPDEGALDGGHGVRSSQHGHDAQHDVIRAGAQHLDALGQAAGDALLGEGLLQDRLERLSDLSVRPATQRGEGWVSH